MADKDALTKDYMQDPERFADVFNYLLYDGKQVINPENLKPQDSASLAIPYGEDGKNVPIQKFRDVFKLASIMEDSDAVYLLLGIENQSEIHYAMPVRNMVYDSLAYNKQVDEKSEEKSRRRQSVRSGVSLGVPQDGQIASGNNAGRLLRRGRMDRSEGFAQYVRRKRAHSSFCS